MESPSKHSAVTQRRLRDLVACLLVSFGASSVLACSSDSSDDDGKTTSAAEKDSKDDGAKAGSGGDKKDAGAVVEEFKPKVNAEQEATSKDQMRFDGAWKGTTSQDKPISFRILSRFLGHIEITYKLEGDDCKADDRTAKVSAMVGLRSSAFTLMNSNSTEKLMATAMFTADSESNGTFSVTPSGDLPKGCNASVSGTWKATK